MTIISPSVLSLDFSDFKEQVAQLNKSGAKWIHFDVMDGHFVPNISFGSDILKAFKKSSDLFLDVHLMISNPDFYLDSFIVAGADLITFHYEALKDMEECIALARKIREKGLKAGISIKPKTSESVLYDVMNEFDLILVMSVEPGFGGQKFHTEAVDKIRNLNTRRKEVSSSVLIEVDGGINAETGKLCKEAGCDVLVAGSYVFKNNIKEAVESLL